MGMFTEGYIQTVQETIAIDENYSGILGCFQIVSDSIHNEQVMFESLFTLDYTTALNEEMSDSNPIKKIGTFILKMIELVKAKIKSIIASVKEKFNKKKSKDLKDKVEEVKSKYKKPPTTHGATRNKSVEDKPEKEVKPSFKTKYSSDKYNDDDKIKDQDKIDISLHNLNGGFDLENEKIQNLIKKYSATHNRLLDNVDFTKLVSRDLSEYNKVVKDAIENINKYSEDDIMDNIENKASISATKILCMYGYNVYKDPKLFIKNLQDPSYIIDNTYKEIDHIEKQANEVLDNLKKEVLGVMASKETTSESEKENLKKLRLIKICITSEQKRIVDVIKYLSIIATDTYSKYLYSLNYLLHDKSIDEAVELEESVKYDVDMDFDLL